MVSTLACRFLNGLFGPGSPPAPVWGDRNDLTLLAVALKAGQSISQSTSTQGLPESSHAVQLAIGRLQQAGRIPADLDKVQGLSDEQRVAFGFEPRNFEGASLQSTGVPSFKNFDIGGFLTSLRFVARCQQLINGPKPVFQLGVLSLTVKGIQQQFLAQTFQAAAGQVTDTIWLYRWCVLGEEGEYEEHWRSFEGPLAQLGAPAAPEAAQALQPEAGQRSHSTNPGASQQSTTGRQGRCNPYQFFQHSELSDDELFASPPDLIQGDAILRLAQGYSNGEIFSRINAAHPGGVKSVNVITKRLTHAIQQVATAQGRSTAEIRSEIAQAKRDNGVVHKMKVDVTHYG